MPPRRNPRTFKAPRLAKETETTILRVDQYKDKDEGWKVRKKLMAQMDKRREDWWKNQRCRHEDSERFWGKGVFLGDEVAVEYDDEDIDKIEAIFVVEYTDGDREDIDNDEIKNASEQYVEVSGANDDTPEGSLRSESGEEESYVPSLKVSLSAYFYSFCTPY